MASYEAHADKQIKHQALDALRHELRSGTLGLRTAVPHTSLSFADLQTADLMLRVPLDPVTPSARQFCSFYWFYSSN